ncbi:hypothetical protein PBT90_19795 [Algoriphagus halophytocola]|uniref:Lipoprotein n=1 Tax=Algoriphagus halophytocola TaxID=2991499 RepID=A0ABY6MHI3_9BACT|nr:MULTISPECIES: hypothetical protein [unclassified Algoriphagus]UZD21761.1 hypothetical protein OM944_13930 [Algoriphagus sp. TR-M5]WBL42973.1 hypothetical protein PBT90_19795 [Algoriphagus sp. TR-M9]
MKALKFNPLYLLLLLTFASSCDTSDDPVPEPDLAVVEEDLAVNAALEDLDNITLSAMSNSSLGMRTAVEIPSNNICAAATIILDEANKTISIDFGDGCTSENGTVRKGIINLAYSGNVLFQGATIVATFEDYEVNGFQVEGKRTITNTGVDLDANSISLEVKVENGKVTWPDGSYVTYTSFQSREITLSTQGYQASITGTASGVSREGFEYSTSVVEPLIFRQDCIATGNTLASSGVLQFDFRGIEVSMDFGNGACDRSGTVVYPGGSKEITID